VQASRVGACSVFTALALSAPAQAVNWRFTPSIGSTVTLSDNVNQSANNEESGGSLSVTPGFTLQSLGSRRVQANVNYGLSAVTRFGGNSDSDLYHNLGASLKSEVVEDFFFVDANASVSQQLISLFGSPADASVNDSNRATVGSFSISPYIQKRLGTFANLQARYTTGGAIFSDNAASNSNINAFSAGLTSGTQFNDLSWGLNYSIREANNRDVSDSTFESIVATAGYALSRKFRVFATVGEDRNDFLSANETDGSSYSVGFGWSPSRRASIEASVGERFFGTTFKLSGAYRTRASSLSVRYHEDVSDISQRQIEDNGRFYWICNGGQDLFETLDANPPPGESDCSGPYNSLTISSAIQQIAPQVTIEYLENAGLLNIVTNNGVYIIKGFNAGWTWSVGPRTSLGLSMYDTRFLYQVVDQAEDRTRGINTSLRYRLTPRTNASGSLSFTQNSSTATSVTTADRDDKSISLSLGLSHRFSKDTGGALTFRHTQRDSNAANADYDENSLSASVNMRF
jgi:uncharacterized protein (PEP-CTERM system associated)